MLAQTDKSGIVRDLSNNALLSNDRIALMTHREEHRKKLELHNKLNDINIMKEQIQQCLSLRDEISELRQLLQDHIERDNKWLA
jgi:hypothetical protein